MPDSAQAVTLTDVLAGKDLEAMGVPDRRLPEKGPSDGPDLGLDLMHCRIGPCMKSRAAPLAQRQRRAPPPIARAAHAGPQRSRSRPERVRADLAGSVQQALEPAHMAVRLSDRGEAPGGYQTKRALALDDGHFDYLHFRLYAV